MKFIDRTEEVRYLKEAAELSKSKLFTVSITGLRRVGKTRLILELLSKADLYFFVNKDKESTSLLQEYSDVLKTRKILTELEVLTDWDAFFRILFERLEGIVAFDEFQNFMAVDRSAYGTLQKYIDLNENRTGLFIIFSGSTVGLMKKLFSDSKQPLYGRLKRKMPLKPLMFCDTLEVCNTLRINNIEDAVRLYAIFGGFPKYYVTLEDEQLGNAGFEKIMDRLFFDENAVLEDEANQILSLEFGKRSGIYYDILAAIASGNTRISEVASFLRKKETALTRQINELINLFEFVSVEKPVTGGKGIFVINHPIELSPLAKKIPSDPRYVERFQLLVAGTELVNAFSELNDPLDQRERFVAQQEMREAGDAEAMRIDEDFIAALEHGMPPTAGLGMGIDRLTALLTNSHNIKEVILFPTLKPDK